MIKQIINKKTAFILIFLISSNIAFFIDIPFFSFVFGIFYLAFFPGFLILSILRLDTINTLKKILLTIGLSLTFITFFVLITDLILFSVGYTKPLNKEILCISISCAMIALIIINYFLNRGKFLSYNFNFDEKPSFYLNVIAFISVFYSSLIIGTFLMQTGNNNIILIFGFFTVAFSILLITIYHDKIPKPFFPIALLTISLFITLSFSLRSDNIVGADIHREYYLYRITLEDLHWRIINYSPLDSCLTISLLPAIYSIIIGISNNPIFYKVFFSITGSLIPLVIYEISRKYFNIVYAFLAGVLFASNHIFMWTGANARTIFAILFFALGIMVLFSDIESYQYKFLFIIFCSTVIVSHYTTAFQFFFIVLGVWLLQKCISLRYKTSKKLTFSLIVIFFILIFLWYSMITRAAFDYSAIGFFKGTIKTFFEFFSIESRGGALPEVMGVGFNSGTIPRQIHIISQWLVMILIAIGLLSLIIRFKDIITDSSKDRFLMMSLLQKIDTEYILFALMSAGMIIFIVITPQASISLGTDRSYLQMMVILTTIFIIGGMYISWHLNVNPMIIILLIIIPFFFCGTGVFYQVWDVPYEPTFTTESLSYKVYYINIHDIATAIWFHSNIPSSTTINYISNGANAAFRDVSTERKPIIMNYVKIANGEINDYHTFLNYQTVVNGIFISEPHFTIRNFSEYSHLFNGRNRIYTNGGAMTLI